MDQVGNGDHQPGKSPQFREGIFIDLTGATLINFDLHRCSIVSIECSEATFEDGANFAQATFAADAHFNDATFSPAKKGIGDPAADFRCNL